MSTFQKMFEPCQIGSLALKNRLMMTSMSTGFAGRGGMVTDKIIDYYGARAAGGVGLVTVEMVDLNAQLAHVKKGLLLTGPHHIPGLKRLTDRIHSEGAKASVQIGAFFRPHSNGFARYSANDSVPEGDKSLAMNQEEMDFIAGMLARGVEQLRTAGFDAVEIHAVHGSILSEFLSPYWNKRTDEYGGCAKNRVRFAANVMRMIREKVGDTYPVIFRIPISEFTPKGTTVDDAVVFGQELEKAGATAISLSGGLGHLDHIGISPSYFPRGILAAYSGQLRAAIQIPVIVANGLTPEMAEEILADGKADMIGLGRPLIADADWPNKVKEGKTFRPCIRCVQACFGGLRDIRQECIGCIYNCSVGHEQEDQMAMRPAQVSKKVVVIGGGPAGCETARVCAERGHNVTLIEKSSRLGGQFLLAAMAPGKQDFLLLPKYYADIFAELGVKVIYNTEADADMLMAMDADVYVMATGAMPGIPPIPGKDKTIVSTAHAYLSGEFEINEGPVVIVGGGATGLETAHLLAEKDIEVSVVEALTEVGRELTASVGPKEYLLQGLQDKNCHFYTSSRAVRIEDEGLVISDRPLIGGGNETLLPAKWVLFAAGMRPQRALMNTDAVNAGQWYAIGDCEMPGNAYHAIHAAYELAINI